MSSSAASDLAEEPKAKGRGHVLLLGNPNSGKTSLFNGLCGVRARVGNFPGVTVDRRSGEVTLPGGDAIELVDVPGTYSLSARSPEEAVAVNAMWGEAAPSAIVVVLDATALARGLYLALQVRESGIPALIALNMIDEAKSMGLDIDAEALEARCGIPAVELVATSGEGLPRLLTRLEELLHADPSSARETAIDYPGPVAEDVAEVQGVIESSWPMVAPESRRARAAWALLSLDEDELPGVPEPVRIAVRERIRIAEEGERELAQELIAARYAEVDSIVEVSQGQATSRRPWTDRLDALLTNPISGFFAFAAVMLVVFQSLFVWSDPMIGWVEDLIAWAQSGLNGAMSEGVLRGLVVDGVVAGVGNVLVFVPQIALLFVLITLLEDSGYLARVAFVIDRVMNLAGLNGRSFVPLLSGFACAIPAVMATRIIESRRDRLAVMMAVPFMSCSARLPIYVLVTATLFSQVPPVWGFLSVGAIVLFSMYTLSVCAALVSAAILRKTVLKGPKVALVLELPPYRWPHWRNVLLTTGDRVWSFIKDAGTVILAFTILLWALLSYPVNAETTTTFEAARATAVAELDGEAQEARLAEIAGEEAGQRLRESYAGQLGRSFEPIIEPLGFDWRLGIGIIGAFAAREVFVSTLGIVFSIEDADSEEERLRERLRGAEAEDGSPLLTPLVGVSLMVFFVLACQCMSTLAVVKRESKSWRWPIFLFVYMTTLAYIASLAVFQVGSYFGWGGG